MAVAQPRDARVYTRIFEFGIEVGQHRCSRGLMLKPVDVDLDNVAAQLHSSLDPVDELPMDQFRRLVPIGWPEVMTKVVHHMQREETERQRGLDRVEIERRQMVHPQESILGEEVLNTPPFGVGWHGRVRSHVAGGCDQREVGAMTSFLQQASATGRRSPSSSCTRWPRCPRWSGHTAPGGPRQTPPGVSATTSQASRPRPHTGHGGPGSVVRSTTLYPRPGGSLAQGWRASERPNGG